MVPTFYDLPPEVLSLIFGYMAGVELVEISSLFREVIPILSKHLLHNLYDYVQQTPLTIDQRSWSDLDQRARAMAWACRKRIKIGKCHFIFKSSLDLCMFEYVLGSCNISDMETFGLIYGGECIMDASDSPFEVAYKVNRLKSQDDVMDRIAEVLIHRAKNGIRELDLDVDLYPPWIDGMLKLLQHLEFLEKFRLRGFCSIPENIHNILAAIEALPRLRRLDLINIIDSIDETGRKPFKLISKTLEYVFLHRSHNRIFIEECVCPNLKVLCLPVCYATKLVSKLDGKFPYGMQVRKVCNVIPSWTNTMDVCVLFDYMTRPIQGYICPDNCTLLFIRKLNSKV